MNNRLNFVTFNGSRSKRIPFNQGVPQGSVLSLILFLIYINDICDNLNTNVQISIYADDVTCYCSDNNNNRLVSNMQATIDHFSKWANTCKMSLSIDKCSVTHFSTSPQDKYYKPVIGVNGENLKVDEKPVFLGITYDRRLTFDFLVSTAANKVKQPTPPKKLLSAGLLE